MRRTTRRVYPALSSGIAFANLYYRTAGTEFGRERFHGREAMKTTKLFFITMFLVVAGGVGCASTQVANNGSRQPDSIDCNTGTNTNQVACEGASKRVEEKPSQRYMGILETRGGL